MTYRRLQLNAATPAAVRHFLERTVEDLYFSDIHAMLRLPLSSQGIVAGQNFAITQVLMAVISSVSITLYNSKGESADLFKSVVEEFFPWDEEPSNNVSPKAAAGIIYDVFRNPLTHAGGLFVDWRDGQRFLVQKSYTVKVKRRQPYDKTTGLTEEWIEALEVASSRPEMGPTLKVEEVKKVLLVEGLYWCVRRMIQKLTDNTERMANAEKMLSAYT
jgi:hypothetical protein